MGVRRMLGRPTNPTHDLIGGHRAAKTFQRQVAHKIGFDQRLDGAENPLADEDLARFGLLAQSRCMVRDSADYRIVRALIETDAPDGCVPSGNTNSEAKQIVPL